jgi:hypothetical protein
MLRRWMFRVPSSVFSNVFWRLLWAWGQSGNVFTLVLKHICQWNTIYAQWFRWPHSSQYTEHVFQDHLRSTLQPAISITSAI